MKAKDIKVGEAYEVSRYGELVRAVVESVGPMERRVHSSARWDTGGHTSTGIVVVVRPDGTGRELILLPQQVKRPWAEAEPEHDAKAKAKARTKAAVDALVTLGIPARAPWGTTDMVAIHLSAQEAEVLASRLTTTEEEA